MQGLAALAGYQPARGLVNEGTLTRFPTLIIPREVAVLLIVGYPVNPGARLPIQPALKSRALLLGKTGRAGPLLFKNFIGHRQ